MRLTFHDRRTIFFLFLAVIFAAASQSVAAPKVAASTPRVTAASVAPEMQNVDVLFALVNRRLAAMRNVALAKWRNGGAIEDRAREAVVLRRTRDDASRLRLENTDAFARTQIEMAKEVQRQYHARWSREGLAGNEIAPSLSALRTQLNTLDAQILRALPRALPVLHDAKWEKRARLVFLRRVRAGAFSDAQRNQLFDALRLVRFTRTSSTRSSA